MRNVSAGWTNGGINSRYSLKISRSMIFIDSGFRGKFSLATTWASPKNAWELGDISEILCFTYIVYAHLLIFFCIFSYSQSIFSCHERQNFLRYFWTARLVVSTQHPSAVVVFFTYFTLCTLWGKEASCQSVNCFVNGCLCSFQFTKLLEVDNIVIIPYYSFYFNFTVWTFLSVCMV